MIINISELNTHDSINIDTDFTLDLSKYPQTDILALNDLHVSGSIRELEENNLEFDLTISGVMTLKDSITLEEVAYPFNSTNNEEISLEELNLQETYQKNQNTLDILDILWENIVLEVPISFTKSPDATMKGEGWQFGDTTHDNDIDPRLACLDKLTEEREE